MKFDAVPDLAVTSVIAVLLATLGIASNSLNVTIWVGADPNRRPRGRDYQGRDSSQFLLVANGFSICIEVAKSRSGAFADDAWPCFGDILQFGKRSRFHRIGSGELLLLLGSGKGRRGSHPLGETVLLCYW